MNDDIPVNDLPGQIKLSVLMPVYNERFLLETSVRRVMAFRDPAVLDRELIVVDDGSTDGTSAVLERLCEEFPEIHWIKKKNNEGKGAALRSAIPKATGHITVIQDADLEYFPLDWSRMLYPILNMDADAVYGSRFLTSEYRRVLYFWHSVGNRLLTLLSNFMTDLNLTDVSTCYKMIRTELLQSIPIRSKDFSIDVEVTAKLAKRGAVIYEVPIRYSGRTCREGKKVLAKHGMKSLLAVLKWKLIDDIYDEKKYGADILTSLNHVQKLYPLRIGFWKFGA